MFVPLSFFLFVACVDRHSYGIGCTIYKRKGFCKKDNKYYKFMTKSCARTCGFCVDSKFNIYIYVDFQLIGYRDS